MADATINLSAIGFELRFTGTAGANAAAKLRHLDTAPGKSRQQIFKLRQFDLQLAFPGAGVLGKDIEDELGAVNHAGVEDTLDVALLRSGQIVIEENQVGGNRGRCSRNLFQLSFADQSCGIGPVAAGCVPAT